MGADLDGWCAERGIRALAPAAEGGPGAGTGGRAGTLTQELLVAPPRAAEEWGRLGPLLGELAGGDPASNAHAVAAVLEGALRGERVEPAQQLAALAILEALATNSAAFRHGCGTGPGSATERLSAAVREVAEASISPRQSSKARKIFARKKPAPQEFFGRRSRSAHVVLQSFEARALQAHTRGTAAPFYEAFAQARPTARAWAAATAAAESPEASVHHTGKGSADVLGRTECRAGEESGRKGRGKSSGAQQTATASPRMRQGGYPSNAESPAGKRPRLAGSPRFSAKAIHKERSEAPKSDGIEDGGATSEGETAEAEGHAPANLCPAGGDTVVPAGEVDALCRYLQALGGEASRRPAQGLGGFRDESDRAGRLKQLISERQRIRGALERLNGVLEALQSIESRAGAARWAAAAGAQILTGTSSPRRGALASGAGTQSLRGTPSPRRGTLAAACLENI